MELPECELCLNCTPEIRQGVIALKRFLDARYQAYTDIQNWAVYKRMK